MVLTLPLCRAIKEHFPDKKITMISRKYTEPLLINSPVLDSYYFVDEFENGIKDIFKENNFDAAFFPRPRFDEAWGAFIHRIPLRIGSAYRAYSLLFNHRVHDHRKKGEFHETEYNTRLLESIIGEKVKTELVPPYIEHDELSRIKELFIESNISLDKKPIIIHPGSGGSSISWNPDNFGKAAFILSQKLGLTVIITGIESEKELCEKALKCCPNAISLCGKLNLSELIALISISSVFIANSTGTLHIAASLGIPVIGLYPNTPWLSPRRWGPYSDKAWTISPPNGMDDMGLIKIAEVVEAGENMVIR
jgi:heptosyltransferase III